MSSTGRLGALLCPVPTQGPGMKEWLLFVICPMTEAEGKEVWCHMQAPKVTSTPK